MQTEPNPRLADQIGRLEMRRGKAYIAGTDVTTRQIARLLESKWVIGAILLEAHTELTEIDVLVAGAYERGRERGRGEIRTKVFRKNAKPRSTVPACKRLASSRTKKLKKQ